LDRAGVIGGFVGTLGAIFNRLKQKHTISYFHIPALSKKEKKKRKSVNSYKENTKHISHTKRAFKKLTMASS
jgi:hypothetical protein